MRLTNAAAQVHPDQQHGKSVYEQLLAERIFEKLKLEFAKIADEIGDTATAPVSMTSTAPADSAWSTSNVDTQEKI